MSFHRSSYIDRQGGKMIQEEMKALTKKAAKFERYEVLKYK